MHDVIDTLKAFLILCAFCFSVAVVYVYGVQDSEPEQYYNKEGQSYELKLPKSLCIETRHEYICIIPINSYTKEKAQGFCEAIEKGK